MIVYLFQQDIIFYWDKLFPLVEKTLKKMGSDKYYLPSDVLRKCVEGKWQCWVAYSGEIDSVMVTYIVDYPTKNNSFFVFLVGGSKVDEWLSDLWTVFKRFAKDNGCTQIDFAGRKGWLKKLKPLEPRKFDQSSSFTVEI